MMGQPGHEYTKSNVKFGVSVLQSEAVRALEAFADDCKETQGKFTIGDEKVCFLFPDMNQDANMPSNTTSL